MAVKCTCDKCGKENAGRVCIDMSRSTPLEWRKGWAGYKFDHDLCQEHFDELMEKVFECLKTSMPV